MLSNTLIGAPHLSEFPDFGHRVTVGKATSSMGYEVESRISMTGSSIRPAKVFKIQLFEIRTHKHILYSFKALEIKPCGLGTRIRGMEANLIYF